MMSVGDRTALEEAALVSGGRTPAGTDDLAEALVTDPTTGR